MPSSNVSKKHLGSLPRNALGEFFAKRCLSFSPSSSGWYYGTLCIDGQLLQLKSCGRNFMVLGYQNVAKKVVS
jgi:hypothetical protein